MRVWVVSALLVASGCAFDGTGVPGEPGLGSEPEPGKSDDAQAPPESDPEPGLEPDPGYESDSQSLDEEEAGEEETEEPCKPVWVQLLADPAFDDGTGAWVEDGWFTIVGTDAPHEPHTPSMSAQLGGYAYADDYLSQVVQVPADAEALRLRLQLTRHVPVVDIDDEYFAIELYPDEGEPFEVLAELTAEDLSESWQEKVYEAAGSHAGEMVELSFYAETDLSSVSFEVDSVALEALVCQ